MFHYIFDDRESNNCSFFLNSSRDYAIALRFFVENRFRLTFYYKFKDVGCSSKVSYLVRSGDFYSLACHR